MSGVTVRSPPFPLCSPLAPFTILIVITLASWTATRGSARSHGISCSSLQCWWSPLNTSMLAMGENGLRVFGLMWGRAAQIHRPHSLLWLRDIPETSIRPGRLQTGSDSIINRDNILICSRTARHELPAWDNVLLLWSNLPGRDDFTTIRARKGTGFIGSRDTDNLFVNVTN